jgi:hypothetical protein
MPIIDKDYFEMCENFRKRVLRILYLKDDMLGQFISEYDVASYIHALIWDMYGAYVVFSNYKFLNCICELEGIKENLNDDFSRKKILDLANYVSNIPKHKE